MNHTIGAPILFPLHLLAVLLQLLVCQFVEGIGRFWLWWGFRWADWRLTDKQRHRITLQPKGSWKGKDVWRAVRLQLTGGLSTVITLARTWDCGPAVFMSWRFCCRIWGEKNLIEHFWLMWQYAEDKEVTLFRVSITSWGLVKRGTNWFGFSILMAVLPACVSSSAFNH